MISQLIPNFHNAQMATDFAQMDAIREDFSTSAMAQEAFDSVGIFNDTHLIMQSSETLARFFCNVSYLLKPGGYFIAQIQDGAALWYALQKEIPEAPIPDDYVPRFKRTLFSVSLQEMINEKRIGIKYNFKVRKEVPGSAAISLKSGFLINSTEFCNAARLAGLETVHMLNAGEMYELYRGLYGDSLKKKASSKEILKEQRQVLDMYAFCVFRKVSRDATTVNE